MSVSGIASSGGFDVAKMAAEMVKKSDTNEDGSLDKAEFTKALTSMGISAEDAAKKFDSLDKNNTGKISQSDIEADIKEMDKKEGTRPSGPPPGPPPSGGAGKSGSASESSSTTSYDVKDTNKDGTVSAAEELVYDLKNITTANTKATDASSASEETKSNQTSQKIGSNIDVTA